MLDHTAHDIFQLDDHIPEMAVLGETTDISPFGDWVFRDKWVLFPDNALGYLASI